MLVPDGMQSAPTAVLIFVALSSGLSSGGRIKNLNNNILLHLHTTPDSFGNALWLDFTCTGNREDPSSVLWAIVNEVRVQSISFSSSAGTH